MPVTKSSPFPSGHLGIDIAQFPSGLLVAVTRSGSNLHIWRSTDGASSWTQVGSGYTRYTVNSFYGFADENADGSILLRCGGRTVGTNSEAVYRALQEGPNSTVNVGAEFSYTGPVGAPLGNAATAVILHRDERGNVAVGSQAPATGNGAYVGIYGNVHRLASSNSVGTFTWNHAGDGRTPSHPTREYYINNEIAANPPDRWLMYSTKGTVNKLPGPATDFISFGDGQKLWTDDNIAANGRSGMSGIPYSRLAHTLVDSGESGSWRQSGYDRSTRTGFMLHTSGKVLFLDVDTNSFRTSETQTHADFADTTKSWASTEYMQTPVVYYLERNSADVYRVSGSTKPDRPVLTAPARRAVTASTKFDWTFSDPDASDTQGSFELRRQVGNSDTYQYWTGTSWVNTTGANTRVAQTTQTTTLTAAQWRSGTSTEYHWFSLRVNDNGNTPSDWSAPVRIDVQAAPVVTVTTIGEDSTSPFTTVRPLAATITWSATVQEDYRVQVFAANGSNVGTQRYDSGWLTGPTIRSHPYTFAADGETGFVRVSVRAFGSSPVAVTQAYTVDLPDPPGGTTLSVAEHGTPAVALRVTVTSTTTPHAVRADVYRREGTSGDGILIREGLVISSSSRSASFDDYRVASGKTYQYRKQAWTADGGTQLDSTWTT